MDIHSAIRNGGIAVVRSLLQRNPYHLNIRDQKGYTPLMLAVRKGEYEIVTLLLDQDRIDLEALDGRGNTALMIAASQNNDDIFELLLSRHEEIMELLLTQDRIYPQVNTQDTYGRTALMHMAFAQSNNARMTSLLLDQGADPNIQDADGRTALGFAAFYGKENIAKLLLTQDGVDPDILDFTGNTLLMLAAGSSSGLQVARHKKKNKETVELLLTQDKIDISAEDDDGHTALYHIAQNKDQEMLQLFISQDAIGSSAEGSQGRTILSRAAESGNEQLVNMLLQLPQENFHPDARDSDGRTALYWAAEKRHDKVINILIPKDSVTLHMLAKEGNQALTQVLLDAGYDVNACDSGGMTPIQSAVQKKHGNLVQTLLKYKADTKYITASEWRNAFGKEEKEAVQLSEATDRTSYLTFIKADGFSWPPVETETCLYMLAEDALWENVPIPDPKVPLEPKVPSPNKLQTLLAPDTNGRYVDIIVSLWFPVELQLGQHNSNPLDRSKWSIAWRIIRSTNPNILPPRSPVYFSMLPYGWIPNDGVDFFKQFIEHLRGLWLDLCQRAEKDLSQRRLEQLSLQGKSPALMQRLAEDARKCAELRDILEDQVRDATRFVTDYCQQCHTNEAPDLEAVNEFNHSVSSKITKLDQIVRDLLQIEFAWSSITETRISTRLGQNVMLLTYVSIFYLPLAYCAALWAIPNITDNATRTPFIATSLIVGFITLFAALNLEKVAGSAGKVYENWRKKVVKNMREDKNWRGKGEKYQDINIYRRSPSEWWILGFVVSRYVRSLFGRKQRTMEKDSNI
ncbi:hypothetical protein GQX73_g4996 [Xylaria multiplex]|uniref:protein S-acyltransferase n=1 Tax=Xylaria multiplex TaxID=323545 RepID=A0A7C8MM73_9PEZI|nr:hypothetical protein GQX73_g4996 [Xylaria multiplex]